MVSAQIRPETPGFDVRTERADGAVRLIVSGELDLATGPIIEDAFAQLQPGDERVLVDLEHLTFLDASGLRAFLQAERLIAASGGALSLVDCPASIRRVFELTNTQYLLQDGTVPELIEPQDRAVPEFIDLRNGSVPDLIELQDEAVPTLIDLQGVGSLAGRESASSPARAE